MFEVMYIRRTTFVSKPKIKMSLLDDEEFDQLSNVPHQTQHLEQQMEVEDTLNGVFEEPANALSKLELSAQFALLSDDADGQNRDSHSEHYVPPSARSIRRSNCTQKRQLELNGSLVPASSSNARLPPLPSSSAEPDSQTAIKPLARPDFEPVSAFDTLRGKLPAIEDDDDEPEEEWQLPNRGRKRTRNAKQQNSASMVQQKKKTKFASRMRRLQNDNNSSRASPLSADWRKDREGSVGDGSMAGENILDDEEGLQDGGEDSEVHIFIENRKLEKPFNLNRRFSFFTDGSLHSLPQATDWRSCLHSVYKNISDNARS